ncbi:MAG: GAF domain-containing sensor histidine kinase [Ginsengibacter sp.]
MKNKAAYPKPLNEKKRLKALYDYDILDTISEKEYDNITKIASQICNTPVSFITFLDKDRQWFKSYAGIAMKELPREIAFCNYTILDNENVLVVPDMRIDDRYSRNPIVTGEPHAVFYAGAPLVTHDGNALGSICVLDAKENNLTDDQREALKSLAEQVMARLELRKKIKDLYNTQRLLEKANDELKEFAHIASHDMKIPLANISLMSRSFQSRYEKNLDNEAIQYISLIDRSAKELLQFIEDIFIKSTKPGADQESNLVDSYTLIHKVIDMIAPPADFEINITGNFPAVEMNKTSLQQVFQNLITNAIKYNDKKKGTINISCHSDTRFHYFNIEDNGRGIDRKDLKKIFYKKRTLKTPDRYGNLGTGIGLATVKNIIEETGGKICVASKKDTGSVFKICIPLTTATG